MYKIQHTNTNNVTVFMLIKFGFCTITILDGKTHVYAIKRKTNEIL